MVMRFVKTFKGYEDDTKALDKEVNAWIQKNKVEVVDIKATLSHQEGQRTGDLLYTLVYVSDKPVAEEDEQAKGISFF